MPHWEAKTSKGAKTLAEIRVSKDGPYLVSGDLPLTVVTIGANDEGESVRFEWGRKLPHKAQVALCRCGGSASKPIATGPTLRAASTAPRPRAARPTASRPSIAGPTMSLTDAESLCAFARFCDPNGQVGTLVSETDHAEARKNFVLQTSDCPSGRLVAWDNASGEPIEPHYEPSIGLIEDPVEDCSGPLWVRGGIPVTSADGFRYEVRSRVTLCRCGASNNKPFCDGSHAAIKFKEGL